MDYRTGKWTIQRKPGVNLTIRTSAWRHLTSALDPDRHVLVFVWGRFGSQTELGWLVSVNTRDDIATSTQVRPFETRIDGFPVVVVQAQHLEKLNHRTLSYNEGCLLVA